MHVFFDFEFTGLHQKTTPISLGLVPGEGEAACCEFLDYDDSQVDDWLRENVIANLSETGPATRSDVGMYIRSTRAVIAEWVKSYLSKWERVTMVGDCLAYDWVLFCELFGGALNLPKNVSYIPLDLSTLLWQKGEDPDIDRLEYLDLKNVPFMRPHNALTDAYLIRKCFEKVRSHT